MQFEEKGISQVYGIYGVLEEFSAYYFGALSTWELFPYYSSSKEEDALEDYKHKILNDVMAYYEFTLFSGWYMQYAKLKHPDVYTDILSNKPLRVTFTLVEDKFHRLALAADLQLDSLGKVSSPDMLEQLDFSGSVEDIFRFAELAGMPPSMIYKTDSAIVNGKKTAVKRNILDKEDYAELKSTYKQMIAEANTASGGGLLLFFAQSRRAIAYLKKQYTKEILEELDKLRVKGVTTQNYQDFLK